MAGVGRRGRRRNHRHVRCRRHRCRLPDRCGRQRVHRPSPAVAQRLGDPVVRHQRQVGPAHRDRRHAGDRGVDRRVPRRAAVDFRCRRNRDLRPHRNACRLAPAGRIGRRGPTAADRRRSRYPRPGFAASSNTSGRHRDPWPVAGAARLGSSAVPRVDRLGRGGGRGSRWNRPDHRTSPGPGDPPDDPRLAPSSVRTGRRRPRFRPMPPSTRSRRSSRRTATSTASTRRSRSRGSACRAGRSTSVAWSTSR